MAEAHHPTGHRSERVAEEIKNEVSLMLAGELKDPRLALPIIVTEVRLAPGMRTLRVFVRLEGTEEEQAAALAGLRAAAKLLENKRDDVATTVELSGPIGGKNTNTLQTILKLIENGFFNAILPGFDRQVPKPKR